MDCICDKLLEQKEAMKARGELTRIGAEKCFCCTHCLYCHECSCHGDPCSKCGKCDECCEKGTATR